MCVAGVSHFRHNCMSEQIARTSLSDSLPMSDQFSAARPVLGKLKVDGSKRWCVELPKMGSAQIRSPKKIAHAGIHIFTCCHLCMNFLQSTVNSWKQNVPISDFLQRGFCGMWSVKHCGIRTAVCKNFK